ncbi:hypothetical protein V8E55_008567 [Tylopilus felleus]
MYHYASDSLLCHISPHLRLPQNKKQTLLKTMSSALQSALTSLQQNNYLSLVMFTAVGYDYVLTLSDEVEYIWTQPWTWVSTLFIIIRYSGLFTLITACFVGSSFLAGSVKTYVFDLP